MSHLYDTIQLKTIKNNLKEKNRHQDEETVVNSTLKKPKKRFSEMIFFNKQHHQQQHHQAKSDEDFVHQIENENPSEFGSNETILMEKLTEDEDLLKKTTKIHQQQFSSTTTTIIGMDDGYESSNSTPLVSGKGRTKLNNTNLMNLNVTASNLRKKDLHVQLLLEEEDEHESFINVSPTTICEIDPDPDHQSFIGPDPELDNRETWGSNTDFLLSIIGFAVDLANIWRFPYLCYRNGGGAFLIPYTLMLIFGAVPLFYMELILGQFNRQGPISLWRICPLFKGVGFCAVLIAFYVSFYYNVILAWALYYLGSSVSEELPWMHCNNSWNTEQCWELRLNKSEILSLNESFIMRNSKFSPAFEFFHRAVLEMQWSDGLHEMGYPKWQLVLCLIMIYSLLYVSLFKGVKSSGKVVWVTATMPYVVLTILLARGLVLPGSFGGISYYLKPQLSKLRDSQVWLDAAVQIFYSVGAGFGVHLSYASYNTFHNNCYRDCIITTIVNCFTSFFSGFVIFTYLGYMSHKQGVDIKYVATEGPGLVFQVYPEAVATLPGSHLWSILFFFMLIMLGLDSAMGGLECVITGLMDEFSGFFRRKKITREFFTFVVIAMSFSVALINVTPGGIYMFHLFDTYSAGISLLCSALFEAIAVSWFYGLDRLSQDVEAMLGIKPGLYWRICWKFISPSFIVCVVLFGLFNNQTLVYNEYFYPNWAEWLGWSLALSSILMIPLMAIIQLIKTKGTFRERLALSISPIEEHEDIRRNKLVHRFKAKHWFYV